MKLSQQAKEAAGTFTGKGPVPTYGNPQLHPLRRALDCLEVVRETVVLAHPHVDALLIMAGGRLRALRTPKKQYDLVRDFDLQSLVIAGAIGDEC